MNEQLQRITEMAHQHAENLERDIKNASTRIEHLRLTTLTLEAQRLALSLDTLTRSL
jgi:hypothetical protein